VWDSGKVWIAKRYPERICVEVQKMKVAGTKALTPLLEE
jgi:hypothetical protein